MSSSSKASQSNTTYDQKITTGGEAITAAHNSSININTLDADLAAHNLNLMASLSGDAIGSTRSLAEDVIYAAGGAMADMKSFSESTIGSMKSLAEGTNEKAFGLTEKVLDINSEQNKGTQAMADNMLTTMRDFMGKLSGESDAKVSGAAAMTESSKGVFERNPMLAIFMAGASLLGFLAFLFIRKPRHA